MLINALGTEIGYNLTRDNILYDDFKHQVNHYILQKFDCDLDYTLWYGIFKETFDEALLLLNEQYEIARNDIRDIQWDMRETNVMMRRPYNMDIVFVITDPWYILKHPFSYIRKHIKFIKIKTFIFIFIKSGLHW